jgi:Flp pilus assembly protein TadD
MNDRQPGKIEGILNKAVACIAERDFAKAEGYIAQAMSFDMEAPEPHNLLGALLEFSGKTNLALRHYRAAYALKPSYKPACRNIERLVLDSSDQRGQKPDIGLDGNDADDIRTALKSLLK